MCGRKVELSVEDHGYDPQRAVGIYRLLELKVAGFQRMLGAPITTALSKNINTTDKVLTSVTLWPSNLLGQPYMFITGSTYDIETISAIDFLMTDKGLKSGDKVGHVYFEGELGENALLGSKYATEKNGLQLVEQVIKATDTDLSPQVVGARAGEGGRHHHLRCATPDRFARGHRPFQATRRPNRHQPARASPRTSSRRRPERD